MVRILRTYDTGMGRHLYIFVFVIISVLVTTDAFARNGRQTQIPNNQWSCEVCHTQAGGLNDFGFDSFDYTSGGTVDWNGLSQLDSDRDGYSNGLELADPNGTGGNNGGQISHPGDPNDGLCGNGNIEGDEECEAGQLGGATCASMGLVAGNLSCGDTCRFDTSSCDACGDGVIQGSEECDGADLGGNTCESLGRGTGTLSCNGCSYNFIGCAADDDPTPLTCGDGIRQADETCDGSDLGGQTCATMGYSGGVLGCQVRCGEFDTSGCVGGDGFPQTGTPGTPPGQNPNSPNDSVAPGAPGSVDGEQKIELQGYACSTTSSASRSSFWSGAFLLFGLLGLLLRRRRCG